MVCQFYLSFQRISFWLCWFLLWSLFVSFGLIYALIFKISFLLLPWGSSFLPFLVALGVELGYLFDFFSCFLRFACIAMNFPLRTAFTVSHRFWLLCFHFHSFLAYFDFIFWFLLWFVGYSAVCCSASICWNF